MKKIRLLGILLCLTLVLGLMRSGRCIYVCQILPHAGAGADDGDEPDGVCRWG